MILFVCSLSYCSFSVFEHTDPKILCGSHWNIFSHLWTYSCKLFVFPVHNHAYVTAITVTYKRQ